AHRLGRNVECPQIARPRLEAQDVSRYTERLHALRHGSIYNFSLWVLPIVIALFTAFAVFRFTPLSPPSQGEPLTFRSLPLAAGHVTPQQAVEALRIIPQQNRAELQGGT